MKQSKILRVIFLSLTLLIMASILTAEDKDTGDKKFIHRWNQDSVNWQNAEGIKPDITETTREWPAERLGIIGPIVLSGGSGIKAYLLIYDPAGILVGKVNKKEAEENPELINSIMDLACRRARIQNKWSLKKMQEEAARNQEVIHGRK